MSEKWKYYECPKCYMTIEYEGQVCMCLPEGKTCKDCIFIDRCKSFGITKDSSIKCDWHPIKFRPYKWMGPKEE